MQLGFNTNFRYRGVLFHVQTEDSGRENPHVITHLFHGGNIIASVKHDYAELLSEQDLQTAVRKLMEEQHKAMLRTLSRGGHDAAISERMGPDVFREVSPTDRAEPPTITEEERPSEITASSMPAAESAPASAPSRAVSSSATPAPAPAPSPTPDAAPAASPPPSVAEPTVLGGDTIPPAEPASRLSRVFGDRVVSEKPLDEVVLDYLVENARKRKRQPK